MPNLTLGFLAISILPGVKVLGGPSQNEYLPMIAHDASQALDDMTLKTRSGWIAGVLELERPPIELVSECKPGVKLEELSIHFQELPLSAAVGELNFFEYLEVGQMMHQSYNGIGRLSLSHAPTRLERNDTLSDELGVNIWIKYESELDAYSSGNKVRKLEYVLADVINTNSDTVVTAGGSNSNQCKAVAIYARRLGIKCELIVCDFEPMPEANGNYLIDLLMGAKVKKLPGSEWTNIEHHLDELVERLKVEGKKPYLLPPGSSDWRGSLGYIDMAKELAAQEAEIGTNFDHIVFPTGSGGMHTGLLAGTTMLNRPWNLTGICVLEDNSFSESKYLAILDDLEKYADIPSTVRSQSHFETHDGAVCGGYNQYDDQVVQAVVDAGRNHGLLIDPVYMGKAMLGLNQLIEEGKIVKDSNVILLHTGGTYILFGNEQQLSQNLRQPLTLGDI